MLFENQFSTELVISSGFSGLPVKYLVLTHVNTVFWELKKISVLWCNHSGKQKKIRLLKKMIRL